MYTGETSNSFNNSLDIMTFIDDIDIYNSEILLNLDLVEVNETQLVNKFDGRLDLLVDDDINLYGITGIKNRIRSPGDIYVGKSMIKLNNDIFGKIIMQW